MRLGINEFVLSFKTIAELNIELDDKLVIYKKKKKIGREIDYFRKKIKEVAKLQKKKKSK